ncbi:MAG: alpha/beta hydrolase family protein [Bacteroidota bacterium]|nr:alpha/beta hydrolase family protein [Bacteroidota bacterium]
MNRRFFSLLFAVTCLSTLHAATVDTAGIYSNSMHKTIKCVVIRPVVLQEKPAPLPVLYLLHGYSGNFSNWISKVPELKIYADEYELMIVCPDGDYSSWYFDSPVDTSMRYETYIAKEVPEYIDAHYPTIKDRKGRAITGLSMGGHGGLFLAFRHADVFGACGSMSGGVNLQDSRNKFDVIKRIGDTIRDADNWKKYSVMTIIENYPKDSLAIIFDCGTEDFFYTSNHALHEKMLKLKIPHDYIERPGSHNWVYWANAVKYQLLFFKTFFDRKN